MKKAQHHPQISQTRKRKRRSSSRLTSQPLQQQDLRNNSRRDRKSDQSSSHRSHPRRSKNPRSTRSSQTHYSLLSTQQNLPRIQKTRGSTRRHHLQRTNLPPTRSKPSQRRLTKFQTSRLFKGVNLL